MGTKFWGSQKKLHISVEYFVDWLANHNPPWAAYRSFLSIHVIVLDKLPREQPVVIIETWLRLFENFVLKVTGSKATHAHKDEQICAGLKA